MSDLWDELAATARLSAPCADDVCLIYFEASQGYALFQHIDPRPRACTVCPPHVTPSRVVSTHTVQTVRRNVVVEQLARWLRHCHDDLVG
jgi:hypothetical protein